MSGLRSRLAKLAARLRGDQPPGRAHDTAVVVVPREVPYEVWDDWLASQPCACGQFQCPERTIGVLLPTKDEPL